MNREQIIRVLSTIPIKWDSDGKPVQHLMDEDDAALAADALLAAEEGLS